MALFSGADFLGRVFRTFAVAFALGLAACDRTPTDAALTADLAAYVESGYAAGLLDMAEARRRGGGFLASLERERRTVPFTAQLKLKRNHDFGTWDQANARTLIYLLGANPEDVKGIKAAGNKTGDVIELSGSVVYVRSGDAWVLEAGSITRSETVETISTGRWGAAAALGRFVAGVVDAVSPGEKSAATLRELASAGIRISAHLARQDGGWAVASGPEDGTYWRTADAVAVTNARDGVNVATSGARQNLALLRQGAVTAAMMRSTEASLAAAGTGPFADDGTFPALRALASLFPEHIQVAVMAGSPLSSVAELYGMRVAVAANGSSAVTEATEILRAHRVPVTALAALPAELTIDAALETLRKGEVDAVIVTAPAPAPGLRDFVVSHGLRFLPLDADAIAVLTAGVTNYLAMTLPAQTYPGQDRPIATVGTTTVLVSSTAIAAAEAEGLLRAVFGEVDYIGHGSALGTMIRKPLAQSGLTLPLHPGAEAFFGVLAQAQPRKEP